MSFSFMNCSLMHFSEEDFDRSKGFKGEAGVLGDQMGNSGLVLPFSGNEKGPESRSRMPAA